MWNGNDQFSYNNLIKNIKISSIHPMKNFTIQVQDLETNHLNCIICWLDTMIIILQSKPPSRNSNSDIINISNAYTPVRWWQNLRQLNTYHICISCLTIQQEIKYFIILIIQVKYINSSTTKNRTDI